MGINKQGYEAKMNEHQNQMQKGECALAILAVHCSLPLLAHTDTHWRLYNGDVTRCQKPDPQIRLLFFLFFFFFWSSFWLAAS